MNALRRETRRVRGAPVAATRWARAPRLAAAWLLIASAAACTSLTVTPRPSREVSPAPAEPPAEQPGAAAPSAPSRPRSDTSAPTQELLQQSRAARGAGNYPLATSTIERALRIDPDSAALWLELGEIALATGETKQAETLARKALALAADDSAVTAQAERLLHAAGTR